MIKYIGMDKGKYKFCFCEYNVCLFCYYTLYLNNTIQKNKHLYIYCEMFCQMVLLHIIGIWYLDIFCMDILLERGYGFLIVFTDKKSVLCVLHVLYCLNVNKPIFL